MKTKEQLTVELAQVQHKCIEFINNNGAWPATEKKVSVKSVTRKNFLRNGRKIELL